MGVRLLYRRLGCGSKYVRRGVGPFFNANIYCYFVVIAHAGLFELKEEPPSVFGIGVTLSITGGKSSYPGSKRFSVISRKWGDPHNVSLQVCDVRHLSRFLVCFSRINTTWLNR